MVQNEYTFVTISVIILTNTLILVNYVQLDKKLIAIEKDKEIVLKTSENIPK